jgi:hypothetical protein
MDDPPTSFVWTGARYPLTPAGGRHFAAIMAQAQASVPPSRKFRQSSPAAIVCKRIQWLAATGPARVGRMAEIDPQRIAAKPPNKAPSTAAIAGFRLPIARATMGQP